MFWVTLVVLIDQLSKMLVEKLVFQPVFVIQGFLWLTYTRNTGIVFGLFSRAPWVLWVTFTVTLILSFVSSFIKGPSLTKIGLQMIVGGAIGNIIDRFRFGYVVDFINLRYFPAIFNIADLFITIGGVLILLGLVIGEKSLGDKGEQR